MTPLNRITLPLSRYSGPKGKFNVAPESSVQKTMYIISAVRLHYSYFWSIFVICLIWITHWMSYLGKIKIFIPSGTHYISIATPVSLAQFVR